MQIIAKIKIFDDCPICRNDKGETIDFTHCFRALKFWDALYLRKTERAEFYLFAANTEEFILLSKK